MTKGPRLELLDDDRAVLHTAAQDVPMVRVINMNTIIALHSYNLADIHSESWTRSMWIDSNGASYLRRGDKFYEVEVPCQTCH